MHPMFLGRFLTPLYFGHGSHKGKNLVLGGCTKWDTGSQLCRNYMYAVGSCSLYVLARKWLAG